jgi:hypothetical protein
MALLLLSVGVAQADEGLWTFDDFPRATVQATYGFEPSPEWLDHVRLASVRLAGGCSGSFVSPEGLVMTNHHCAHSCIEQLSTAEKDFVASGFYAKTGAAEAHCPEIEVNQLVGITDVTSRMSAATGNLSGAAFAEVQRAEMSRIENECAEGADVRCDVVTLYHGGHYDLYKYRRYQDVRLVFAPEFSIAFFGGDPDNFEFPRYDLDVAFLRVYDKGRPAKVEHYFKWSDAGAKKGDLTFVSGHPGSTSRLLTIAQLEDERDLELPDRLISQAELRGMLTEFQRRGPEQKRISNSMLFYVENSLKALRGRFDALTSRVAFAAKKAREADLRAQVAAREDLKGAYGDAWDQIARAQEEFRSIRVPFRYLEQGRAFRSKLFEQARTLVRAADELQKPNEKRLREFAASNLPAIEQDVDSTAPIHPELEIATLTFSLTKFREALGPDDPLVKKVLGTASPEDLAKALVQGSRLAEPKIRRALFDGGRAAVEASDDAMIRFARRIDGDARAVRSRYEDGIEPILIQGSERIARAQFALRGFADYPDATFTLRLSFGKVEGWKENGNTVEPITTMRGAFDRQTGRPPFDLPASWLKARERLALDTPFNLVTDNDIIGGNSGSPMIDRNARIVGLVFDGNIHSLGGDYWFEDATNRTVAVHSAALLEALDKIYEARRLVDELARARR